jgi:ornithine cyclodeaminase/alanine dehydrogenase-like protein (mu-crystallin family)
MEPLRILDLAEIRRTLVYSEIIDRMRDALVAYSSGECDTPLPMHLYIPPGAEVHMKSSYRRGGRYFVLKVASTFPANVEKGLPTGSGMMLLCSAETGAPTALLADEGHLTDVRTAAVSAMAARELAAPKTTTIGILGTGIQTRLQARMHAAVLPIQTIWIWGRNRERAEAMRNDLADLAEIRIAESPAEVAREARLIITATASRAPLLFAKDIHPGTFISAVGSDSPGKQELDPAILRHENRFLLVDSRRQCERLGELQHAPDQWTRAIELGDFLGKPICGEPDRLIICDFTGLGVEDLYIAEYCYERSAG